MVNWRYVGGATGLQLLRPEVMAPFGSYTRMLFVVMALLAVIAVSVARYIQVSLDRARAARDPRLGGGGRVLRRADAQAEALRLHGVGRADGRGRRADADVPLVHRAGVELQPQLGRVGALAMPMIGGTGALDRPGDRRAAARLDPADRHRDHLQRDQRAGGRRAAGALRRAGAGRNRRACSRQMDAPLLQVKQRVEALRRLHRAVRGEPRHRAGRALRPDRAERLGQDHAHQLHLGLAAQRRRLDPFQRCRNLEAAGLSSHAPGHRAQLPDPAAVPQHDGAGKPAGAARPTSRTCARPRPRRRRWRSSRASASPTRPACWRASCRRSSCASSSWRAPWRRSRAC